MGGENYKLASKDTNVGKSRVFSPKIYRDKEIGKQRITAGTETFGREESKIL